MGRAVRASVAFVIPLLICHALGRMGDAVFIAMAAQTIALPDLRGPYGMRLMILATMILTVAGAAMLGVLSGGSLAGAALAMGFLALLGGAWRHLSADYGPPLSVSSALLFLLGLSQAGDVAQALHLAGLIMLGGTAAALLHVVFWPLRPQHPLRYAVAETWVAASDVLAAMRPFPEEKGPPLEERESELRATLDRTFVILGAAKGRQSAELLKHLEDMRVEVVHLVMRALAFHGALEPLLRRATFARHLPTVDSVLKSLSDAARSVAITLITHRPVNASVTEVRMQRSLHLIQVLKETTAGADDPGLLAALHAALDQITLLLARLRKELADTIDQAQAPAGFPARLPDLSRRPVRSLAAWINPASQIDPVLLRYSLRMAVLTMAAVLLYRGLEITRGYWIVFTIVVVLQPDYGSTRKRAAERIFGTLAGAVLGSALLWIRLPVFAIDGLAWAMAFGFAWFLKRRYDIAVFFVTLMLVLVMGITAPVHLDFTLTRLLCTLAGGGVALLAALGYDVAVFFVTLMLVLVMCIAAPVHLDFTLTRLLCTLAGGGMALLAALVFWPVWEGERFTSLLAAAIRANETFLQGIEVILENSAPPGHDLLMVKRRAENANRHAAASLQRLLAEPSSHHAAPERLIALTTYNQRITRALTAIAVHLPEDPAGLHDAVPGSVRRMQPLLKSLAQAIEQGGDGPAQAELKQQLAALEEEAPPSHASPATELVWTQLAKGIAEIRAMTLALGAPDPEPRTGRQRRLAEGGDESAG